MIGSASVAVGQNRTVGQNRKGQIMFKILLGAMVGVFVGAFAVEIVRRKRPEAVKMLENKAAALVDSVMGPAEPQSD